MTPEHAQSLLTLSAGSKKPVELVFDNQNGKKLTVRNLWLLNLYPGENPFIMRVVLADVRWFWSYAHILKRYNMHRHANVRRPLAPDTPAQLIPTVPKVQYWAWSVKASGQKYTPREVIESIIGQANYKAFPGYKPQIIFDESIGSMVQNIPVENFVVDDPGDQAVARVMAYMPEGKVYVDTDGNVVVDSKSTGAEGDVISSIFPEQVNKGHVEYIDNRLMRPSKIEVYFTREVELRFDFQETTLANLPAGSTVTATDQNPLGDFRRMENVLPLPDYSWPMGQGLVCQGTYVTFDDAFQSWGRLPNPYGGVSRNLDHDLVQKAFIPYNDLWACLGLVGQTDPNADWASRIAATQGHYRRTFRINSAWMDRILSIRPYRVNTIDRISGQRAPAVAYADYTLLNTTRSLWKDFSAGQDLKYFIGMYCYPPNGNIGPTTRPAPAKVSIPEPDQGIIHIDYMVDLWRVYEMVLPSIVQEYVGGNCRKYQGTIAFDAVVDPTAPLPRLSPDFKCAIIVTVIPASPNHLDQLQMVEVKPEDLKGMVPNDKALENAVGPVMQIRIGAGVETARIPWFDAYADDIERVFGVNHGVAQQVQVDEGGVAIEEATDYNERLKDICLNLGDPHDTIAASLTNIAKAAAARVYASLIDRYQGSRTGDLTPGANPKGWSDSITHEVSTLGVCTTQISLPDKIEQFPLMSFLDSSSRNVLLKLVQP
jgi:hypothetical protein